MTHRPDLVHTCIGPIQCSKQFWITCQHLKIRTCPFSWNIKSSGKLSPIFHPDTISCIWIVVTPLNEPYSVLFTPVLHSLLFYIQTYLSLLIYITFLGPEGTAVLDCVFWQPPTPVPGYTGRGIDPSRFCFFKKFQIVLTTHYIRTVVLNWRWVRSPGDIRSGDSFRCHNCWEGMLLASNG